MDIVVVIVLAIAQLVLFVMLVSREPRRPGTGRQQKLFAGLCVLAAIAVLIAQKDNLSGLAPLAIAAFFVVDAVGLAISAFKQDGRDRADAEIRDALDGAIPPGDT